MIVKRIKNELSFHAEQLTIESLSWRYRGNEFDNRGGVETIILTRIPHYATSHPSREGGSRDHNDPFQILFIVPPLLYLIIDIFDDILELSINHFTRCHKRSLLRISSIDRFGHPQRPARIECFKERRCICEFGADIAACGFVIIERRPNFWFFWRTLAC